MSRRTPGPRVRRRARRGLVLAGLVMAAAAHAQPVTYTLDRAHTSVWWEVRHFGTSTHRGRFDDVDGRVALDRVAGTGEVSMRVRTASVSSGVPALDRVLRSDRFLASEAHPEAWFVASRMTLQGGRLVAVRGEFTWRGVSQPLELRATRFTCRRDEASGRETCGGDFEARLRRSDHGSTYALPFVADEVVLHVAIEARATP